MALVAAHAAAQHGWQSAPAIGGAHTRHVRRGCDGLGTGCGAAAAQVAQLSAELEACRAAKSGLKGALQQRLRELIIADKLRQREAEMELNGGQSDS